MSRYVVIAALAVLTYYRLPTRRAEAVGRTPPGQDDPTMQGNGAEGGACAVREEPAGQRHLRDAMNALHEIMVSQVGALSIDGTCSKHGWYLICNQKTLSGTKNVIYRLSSADDGWDRQILRLIGGSSDEAAEVS